MNKDKENTKQKLLEAVGEVLAERGYEGIGVNAIAKKAGVDKVLIYRYFGNLDGLLEAFVLRKDFLSNLKNLFGDWHDFATREEALELGKRIMTGQLHQILGNKSLQEILLWELNEKNRVTTAVAEAREEQGLSVMSRMARVVDNDRVDIAAISSLMVGGIYYLALRSRTVEFFNGINLRTDQGWGRIEASLNALVDMVARDGSGGESASPGGAREDMSSKGPGKEEGL